jgi:hypothetical protein
MLVLGFDDETVRFPLGRFGGMFPGRSEFLREGVAKGSDKKGAAAIFRCGATRKYAFYGTVKF